MVSGSFFEAGSDAAGVLKFAEAAFDEITLGVEMPVERVFAGTLLGITAIAPLLAMT